ncbi:BCR, YitT family protein [Bacillus sp. T3]|uniref:YczE/YyaS/YitT family protein n=1 Tax=Bacillus sp. T3 TaxID=467262 RepID=UPI002980BF4B|nr:BCR, YitT family protein [Bacillus sp. T3]
MVKRITFYLVGLAIACLGVCFLIHSKVGAGPWDVVNMGLTERFGLTLGTWMGLWQAFFLLVNAVLLKRRPEFESIITITIWGLIIDFWMGIVLKNLDLTQAPLSVKCSVFSIGVLFIGMGVGIYLTADLPKMPYDGTMVALSTKFNLSFTITRTMLEGSAVVLSFFVGGSMGIGIGTIIIFVVIGHIVQFFNKASWILYNKKISIFV